jgi:hypothetical protein
MKREEYHQQAWLLGGTMPHRQKPSHILCTEIIVNLCLPTEITNSLSPFMEITNNLYILSHDMSRHSQSMAHTVSHKGCMLDMSNLWRVMPIP